MDPSDIIQEYGGFSFENSIEWNLY
jgi:hypothetical protein